MIGTLETQDIIYDLLQHNDLIYAARSSGLFQSEDGAKTWRNSLSSLGVGDVVITDIIALDEQLYAASTGGVFYLTEGTWQAVPFRRPSPTLSSLAASTDFAEPTMIFAGSLEDGVFRSSDEGKSWTAWNIGLLDLHVLSLSTTNNQVYAGTETGLYKSKNSGKSWEALSLPFEHDAVLSLLSTANQLYIGTENHGLYKFDSSWEKLELKFSGAVNQIVLADGELLILVNDRILRSSKQQKVFDVWGEHSEVSSLALASSDQVLIGFSSGSVIRESL